MWIEIGAVLVTGALGHCTGIARGRYGDKKRSIQYFSVCGCKHSNLVHKNKGTGSCDREWKENGISYSCQCKFFAPKEDE